MNRLKILTAAALVCFAGALSGCAILDQCTPENCAMDKQITQEVNAMLSEHRELGPPGTVRARTINGVVYLNGTVNSDFEVRNTEDWVRRVANVKDVENNLNARSNSR